MRTSTLQGATASAHEVEMVLEWARQPYRSIYELQEELGVSHATVWGVIYRHAESHGIDVDRVIYLSRALGYGARAGIEDCDRSYMRWGHATHSGAIPYELYDQIETAIRTQGRAYRIQPWTQRYSVPGDALRIAVCRMEDVLLLPPPPDPSGPKPVYSRGIRAMNYHGVLEHLASGREVRRVTLDQQYWDRYVAELRSRADIARRVREYVQRRDACLAEMRAIDPRLWREQVSICDRHQVSRRIVLSLLDVRDPWGPTPEHGADVVSARAEYCRRTGARRMRLERVQAARDEGREVVGDVLGALKDGMGPDQLRRWRQALEKQWGWAPGTMRRQRA